MTSPKSLVLVNVFAPKVSFVAQVAAFMFTKNALEADGEVDVNLTQPPNLV